MKVIVKTEIVFVPYSRFRHAIDQYCMHVHCTTTGLFFKWNPFNLGFLCQQAKIGWGCKLKQVFICWSNYMYQHFIYFVFSSLLKRHLTFVRECLKKWFLSLLGLTHGHLLRTAHKLSGTKSEHSHRSTGHSTHLWLADKRQTNL